MALINTTTTGILGTTVYGDGQGALTVQKDGVTQGVYGNIPAFKVYRASSNQTGLTSGVNNLVQFNAISYDTINGWDSVNYKWTPNVAGYYQFCAAADMAPSSGSGTVFSLNLYKNGTSAAVIGSIWPSSGSVNEFAPSGAALLYMNGTTDYVSLYAYVTGTTPLIYYGAAANWTYLSGVLVKAV